MKKFLLINYSSPYENVIEVPYLWLTLKSYFEENSKDHSAWEWLDPITSSKANHVNELIANIISQKPDVIGVSYYMWNNKLTMHVIEHVKLALPNIKVIAGGPDLYFENDKSWFSKYPYVDAICEYSMYGEEFITQYLDGVPIEDIPGAIYPVLNKNYWNRSTTEFKRRDYKFTSAYSNNIDFLKRFKNNTKADIKIILDTARGCPYSCTFCEWGGGTSTKVVFRDLEQTLDDLKTAFEILKPVFIDIINANFGIHENDLIVAKAICDLNMQYKSCRFINMYGPTKTSKTRLKDIYELFIKNKMMFDIKISIQSINEEVLSNIKRIDMNYKEQIDLFNDVSIKYDVPIRFETMIGLPGETLDSFYDGYSKMCQSSYREPVMHIWQMLDSAPAANPNYVSKMKIKTHRLHYTREQHLNHVLPRNMYANIKSEDTQREILEDQLWIHPYDAVIETYSYSKDEWVKMVLFNYYIAFLSRTKLILPYENIIKAHDISLKDFYKELFENIILTNPVIQNAYVKILSDLYDDKPLEIFYVSVKDNLPLISHHAILKFLILLDPNGFFNHMSDHFIQKYGYAEEFKKATDLLVKQIYTPIGDTRYSPTQQIKGVLLMCKSWNDIKCHSKSLNTSL